MFFSLNCRLIKTTRQPTQLTNGSFFPNGKVLALQNKTGQHLTLVNITDSLYNDYVGNSAADAMIKDPAYYSPTWSDGQTIYIDLRNTIIQQYGAILIYGAIKYTDASGNVQIDDYLCINIININGNVFFEYLFDTEPDGSTLGAFVVNSPPATSIVHKTLFVKTAVIDVKVYDTVYLQDNIIKSGEPWPSTIMITNNSMNLTNYDPSSSDAINLTYMFIMDSLGNENEYKFNAIDYTFTGRYKKSGTPEFLLPPTSTYVLFDTDKVTPGNYVAFYFEDNKGETYDITIYNYNGICIVTYDTTCDPSLFPIRYNTYLSKSDFKRDVILTTTTATQDTIAPQTSCSTTTKPHDTDVNKHGTLYRGAAQGTPCPGTTAKPSSWTSNSSNPSNAPPTACSTSSTGVKTFCTYTNWRCRYASTVATACACFTN